MEKLRNGVLLMTVFVAAAVVVEVAAAQTVHVVGENMGWTVPRTGGSTAYTAWASSKRFMVGDILTFNFPTDIHDVLRVTKESYDECTSTNPIGDLIVNGPANVTLSSSGDHFFICTIGRHCLSGQKLSISVTGSGGGILEKLQCPPPEDGSSGGPMTGPPSPSSSSVLASSFFMSVVFVAVSMVV
ncbi:PREDICTED: cucumber peeling cupredoxin-like [Tarenaya hassleriana]|uniref:cucumber peeling cupredoxin-like n=1 Tax=Tarenaya hassleriana TaxID=28532 RepID=UPI00053C60C9|nr:PREDICTED: cucumber peeling cupredoxin-like [Tarenaya hassleriana]